MPMYEMLCINSECKHSFTELYWPSETIPTECPECHQQTLKQCLGSEAPIWWVNGNAATQDGFQRRIRYKEWSKDPNYNGSFASSQQNISRDRSGNVS